MVTRVFPDVGIRVTIGDAAANDRFLEAFEKVAVELDAGAWQLPTGDLAVRIADHLDELDDVLARLEAHAAGAAPAGLTEPDAGGTERWDAGQVWAHLAEFGVVLARPSCARSSTRPAGGAATTIRCRSVARSATRIASR